MTTTAIQIGTTSFARAARVPDRLGWAVAGLDTAFVALVVAFLAPGVTGTVYAAGVLVTLAARGHWRLGASPSLERDLPSILGCASVPVLLAGSMDHLLGGTTALVPVALAATAGLVAVRAATLPAARALRRRGTMAQRTILVGASPTARHLADALRAHPEYGLDLVGVVCGNEEAADLPRLGPPAALPPLVEEFDVRRVIVTCDRPHDAQTVDAIRALAASQAEVFYVPALFELGAGDGLVAEEVWGYPLLPLPAGRRAAAGRVIKRAFDVAAASLMLLPALPVMGVLAVLVKRSSPGPVLFRQERIGQDGQPIEVWKFRSMRVNDDADTTWSVDGDDRVTRIGRFMRDTSLDELPQLFNVLRGDMSLVGPRPERPYFVEQFEATVPGYRDRHRAPAGLTGWAQVHGLRGDTSIDERARFDNRYIETWSLWRDIVILARTLRQLLPGPAPSATPATCDEDKRVAA